MKNKFQTYWQDTFWRHNLIFFSASMFIAMLNYLYYPLLSRIMDVSHFGEVQTLLSIVNIVGLLLAAVQIVIINVSANRTTASPLGNKVINQFEQAAIIIVLTIALLIGVSSVALQNFFAFSSFIPFIILGTVIVTGVPLGFRSAFLQGKQKFATISASGIISAAGKLLFSVILIYFGFKTIGAIGGILIAQLLALTFSAHAAKKAGFISLNKTSLGFKKLTVLKPELKYLVSVIVVSLTLTLMLYGDILVVKRFFSPEIAGQYAGVSTIAKIIFFATAPFSGVLLASVGQAFSTKHNIHIARKSLLLVTAMGGCILLVFCAFPSEILNIMLGSRYAAQAHLLPLLSLAVYLMSLAYMCFYFLLAIRYKYAAIFALAAGTITFLLTLQRHDTLETVIQNFLVGAMLLCAMVASLGLKYYIMVANRASK